MLGMCKR